MATAESSPPTLPLINSPRLNAFMYGCKWKNDPIQTRIFPFILNKISKYFSFKDCRFNLKKSKRCTARIQLYKILKIPNIFTLETSFAGYDVSSVNFISNFSW